MKSGLSFSHSFICLGSVGHSISGSLCAKQTLPLKYTLATSIRSVDLQICLLNMSFKLDYFQNMKTLSA